MVNPSEVVAAALHYLERCQRRGKVKPREFRSDGVAQIRIEGADADGVVVVKVLSRGHRWRLETFGAAKRLKLRVEMMESENAVAVPATRNGDGHAWRR